jgi:hypothetical protein
MPLSHEAFSFLESLIQERSAGNTIGDAIDHLHHRFGRFPAQQELFSWFRDWSAAGLFTAIEIT